MDVSVLRRELKSMIASMLEIQDFRDDQDFIRDLRADSMLLVEIAARVERAYQVQVPDEQLRHVRCLDDAVRVVSRLVNAA